MENLRLNLPRAGRTPVGAARAINGRVFIAGLVIGNIGPGCESAELRLFMAEIPELPDSMRDRCCRLILRGARRTSWARVEYLEPASACRCSFRFAYFRFQQWEQSTTGNKQRILNPDWPTTLAQGYLAVRCHG
ncbi:unnamed protein product [Effrenium voratum]|uniref:Uncharacterized protein n=1 Tax=Effrenium voratum TaxID=2562239 RepID=A0AA36MRE4_9DINO|nr:unnamed protein product [Effrenium voratum]